MGFLRSGHIAAPPFLPFLSTATMITSKDPKDPFCKMRLQKNKETLVLQKANRWTGQTDMWTPDK